MRMCVRVKEQRVTTHLAANAFVLHQFEDSLQGLVKRFFCYGRWQALMVRKHPHYPDRLVAAFLREEKGGRRWLGWTCCHTTTPHKDLAACWIHHELHPGWRADCCAWTKLTAIPRHRPLQRAIDVPEIHFCPRIPKQRVAPIPERDHGNSRQHPQHIRREPTTLLKTM